MYKSSGLVVFFAAALLLGSAGYCSGDQAGMPLRSLQNTATGDTTMDGGLSEEMPEDRNCWDIPGKMNQKPEVTKIPLDQFPEDVTCELDLCDNRFGSRNNDAIKLHSEPAEGRAVVMLVLNPETTEFTKARIEVLYGDKIDGFSVNIGDSVSNNGYGGDSGHNSRDSELQIVGADMSIFGDDFVPQGEEKVLGKAAGLALPGATVVFEISNNQLTWKNDQGVSGQVNSPCLFNLKGQEDKEGKPNFEIFAAFNRVVDGIHRCGTGARRVRITLLH